MINYMHLLIIPCVLSVFGLARFFYYVVQFTTCTTTKTIVSPPLQVERYHLRPESVCVYILDMTAAI